MGPRGAEGSGRARHCTHRSLRRHAPDVVTDIVGDEHCAGSVNGNADRAPKRLSTSIDEASKNVLRHAGGAPRGERHEDHFVAAQRIAVPGAMLTNEGAAGVARRKKPAAVKGKSERGGVGAERVVWNDVLCDQVRPLRLHTRIEVIAEIAVWPAVEPTVLYCGQIVRNEVAAAQIALMDHGPERAALGMPGKAE